MAGYDPCWYASQSFDVYGQYVNNYYGGTGETDRGGLGGEPSLEPSSIEEDVRSTSAYGEVSVC